MSEMNYSDKNELNKINQQIENLSKALEKAQQLSPNGKAKLKKVSKKLQMHKAIIEYGVV